MADEELLDEETEEQTGEEAAEPSLQDQIKEKIDVRVEDVGSLRKKLSITVPQEFISDRLNNQYGELRRDATVPGFRKGRAPRRLLEKRFGSEIGETLVQQFVSSGYMAAVEKTDLKVIGDPMIWVKEPGSETDTLVDVQRAIDIMELPSDKPLEFSCEVEVRPEFELPETEGIPLEKPALTTSDEDIDAQVDRLRGLRGTFETLPDGKVQVDDIVMADIKMSSGGVSIKDQENVRLAARPQHVDGVALEGLGDALKGAKAGDIRTVSGPISDDYIKAEYRGKQADFEIKVREIQRLRLPELDEQFLKGLGFDSEEELRTWVRNELESRLGEAIRRGMGGQVYEYLLDNSKFELPERLSEKQSARVLIRRMLDLYRQGVPQAEVEKHLDELKTGAQESTAKELKLFFIMEKLSEKVEVEVSEQEINAQIAAISQRQNRRFDRVRDELAKEGGLMNLYVQLRDEKIVDQLIAKATITDAKPSEEKPAKSSGAKKKSTKKESAEPAAETKESDEAPATKKPRAKKAPPKE